MSRLSSGRAGAAALGVLCVTTIGTFEGLRTHAYRDSIGIPTICYGETQNVRMGMSRTKAQCNAMFLKRLDEFADGMERCLRDPAHIPPDTYTAFLSLSYNIGTGGFCRSSVARRYNSGDVVGACRAMLTYDRAGGHVLPGLERRRTFERALCLKEG